MSASTATFPTDIKWESDGTNRIPFMAYTDPGQHKKELERFFYRKHWGYVGLEAEIPNGGDFKRTAIGEPSVVMVRAADGSIGVVENICAHRGLPFCRERHGNKKQFVCPHHQWSHSSRTTCRACRSGVASNSMARSTAACRPISRRPTTA